MLSLLKQQYRYLFQHKILLTLTIIAWILSLLPFVFDGQYGCVNGTCGTIIGTNYRDGVWFLSVAKTAFKTWPFQMPIFAGAPLQGYHYLPNLAAYLLSFIGIPVLFTYYKLIPILFMSLMTPLLIHLGRKIHDNLTFVCIFLFSSFFGMHLSLLTSLYHTGHIDNTNLINTFQATRLLESPHTALALLMLIVTLIILYTKKPLRIRDILTLSVIIFLSMGTKVYVAAAIILCVGFYELFTVLHTKKIALFFIHAGIYGASALTAFIIFYNPFSSGSTQSVFIFSPFATVHHMIESPNMFTLNNLVLARYYLYEHGWSPRLWMIELFSTFLFVLYYFGTRIIGFIYIGKQLLTRKIDRFEMSIVSTTFILLLLSVLFIQKGDWFNPIQFAVPGAFLMNIFVAKLLYEIIKAKKILGIVALSMFVLITFPANVVNLFYLNNPARLVIPQAEIEALEFLKKQPSGTILHPIDDKDMAYVSTFAEKPTYVNFINVLQNAGIPYQDRLKKVTPLKDIDITTIDTTYIYLPLINPENEALQKNLNKSPFVQIIFKNKSAVVYKKRAIPQVPDQHEEDDIIVCAQDVKQCPDGSYVPRKPPTCEFAPCPGM